MRRFSVAAARQASAVTPRKPSTFRRDTKVGWYLPVALFVDSVGLALPLATALFATDEAHAVQYAGIATAVWLLVGAVGQRYASWNLGEGRAGPVLRDWLVMLGTLAVLRTVSGLDSAPPAVCAALVPSLVLAIAFRKLLHRDLVATCRDAQALRHVLVVGESGAVDEAVGKLAQRTDHEYVVVGACVADKRDVLSGVPVYTRLREECPALLADDAKAVLEAADAFGADVVFVTPGGNMSGDRLRRLFWALHDHGCPVVVLPGVIDVARHRIRLGSAAGLTLLHIAPPTRHGLAAVLKAVTDRVGAFLLLVAMAPVLAVLALAVRLGSPGPVFYRQTRVGRHNKPFPMWKFRTMVVGADRLKSGLETANENDGHMFKMRHDPRVTSVGRFLRRFSLDELPQLLNVLFGHMSLVGPRPPLPEEVACYDEVEMRRLGVKPGLTGLWQVSGRSDLTWHETVSLDLRYVDNWSLGWDMDVMVRTVRAVLNGRGAY
ncbi:sugar transferase [Streptomyces sp. NPDC000410]|uniref:sugar transferase n=1 Tax=Streptomyces sp. NPDC000410 TaxID=3154254 RepID=UPI00331A256C